MSHPCPVGGCCENVGLMSPLVSLINEVGGTLAYPPSALGSSASACAVIIPPPQAVLSARPGSQGPRGWICKRVCRDQATREGVQGSLPRHKRRNAVQHQEESVQGALLARLYVHYFTTACSQSHRVSRCVDTHACRWFRNTVRLHPHTRRTFSRLIIRGSCFLYSMTCPGRISSTLAT